MAAMWSLATPLMASPDEPAHTIKAAAVARGQFFGEPFPEIHGMVNSDVWVRVPRVFDDTNLLPGCFAFRPTQPASCSPALTDTTAVGKAHTGAGRYEPLYYFVVGLPSLVFTSGFGIHLMRLVSAALCCAFLAAAVESARRRARAFAPLGVAVACTPMVLFLSSVVNPNGLEIAAAVCLWASGLAVVDADPAEPVGRLVTRLGLSAAVLVQVRSLSLLWTALIGVALLVVAGRRRIVELARRTDVRVWGAVFAASTVFALAWLVVYDPLAQIPTPPPHPLSSAAVLETSIGKADGLLHQMVGVVGWIDTQPPTLTYAGWLVALGGVVLVGMAVARRRRWATLAVLVVATVAIPVILESSQANKIGFVWQGRYTLPLAVGIPILAAMSMPDDLGARIGRRVAPALAVVVVLAQGAMFLDALRRYMVGVNGPLLPFSGRWQPPLGGAAVTALFLVALLGYGVVLTAPGLWRGHGGRSSVEPPR